MLLRRNRSGLGHRDKHCDRASQQHIILRGGRVVQNFQGCVALGALPLAVMLLQGEAGDAGRMR